MLPELMDAKLWLRRPSSGFAAPDGVDSPSNIEPRFFFCSTDLDFTMLSAVGTPTSLFPRLLVSLRGCRLPCGPVEPVSASERRVSLDRRVGAG